jgi:hypothetical protein
MSALQLLAASPDSSAHVRLLAELERRPTVATYEVLRTVQGIEASLEATLDRIEEYPRRTLRAGMDLSPSAEAVLLRAGRRQALERLLRLLHMVPAENRGRLWGIIDAFRKGMVLDGIDRARVHDHQVVADWLSGKRPRDFEWDPNRRRWRLRMSTKATDLP